MGGRKGNRADTVLTLADINSLFRTKWSKLAINSRQQKLEAEAPNVGTFSRLSKGLFQFL